AASRTCSAARPRASAARTRCTPTGTTTCTSTHVCAPTRPWSDRTGPRRSGATHPPGARLGAEGSTVIAWLNQLVDVVDDHLTDELDVGRLAAAVGTTEHHLRRMFSALAGMPLSE